MECRSRSIKHGTGELDHPGPLLSFVGNQLAEVGGQTRKHRAAQIGEFRPQFGIGETESATTISRMGPKLFPTSRTIVSHGPTPWPRVSGAFPDAIRIYRRSLCSRAPSLRRFERV